MDEWLTGGGLFSGGNLPEEGETSDTADTAQPDDELTLVGGGGCHHAPSLTPVFVLVWAIRLLAALLFPSACSAADVQLVVPLGTDFVGLRPAGIEQPWSTRLFLVSDVAVTPLALRSSTGDRTALLKTATTVRVGASFAAGAYIQLGVSAPFHVLDFGERRVTGLGDVLIHARVGAQDAPYAVVAELEQTPTDAPQPYATPAVAGGLTFRQGGLGGQVLARVQPEEALGAVVLGPQIELGVGYAGSVFLDVDVALELLGAVPLAQVTSSVQVPVEALLSVGGSPKGRARVRGALGVGLTDGLGTPSTRVLVSVDQGIGPPKDHDADGLLAPVDRCPRDPEDADGFRDRDGCPDPDNDEDGLLDVLDACPDRPETVNGLRDDDGCPDELATWQLRIVGPERWVLTRVDEVHQGLGGDVWTWAGEGGEQRVLVEAEGFLPEAVGAELREGETVTDLVRLEPEILGTLVVRVRDPGGLPVPEALVFVEEEEHAVTDGTLTVEQRVGSPTVRAIAEGYEASEATVEVVRGEEAVLELVLQPAEVDVLGNRLITASTSLFDLDADTLKNPEALERIVRYLEVHPEVLLLRVEGHADPLGTSAYNYELSVRRARGVADFLTERGIDAGRLQVVGSGEAYAGDGPVRQVGFTVIVWAEDE